MPYKNLAKVYDDMMSYVPYQNWVGLIDHVKATRFDNREISIFEIGGGTGTLGSILNYLDYNYKGSDITPSMCEAAWDKGLDFIAADCRSIPIKTTFDLVIFLFDGINYLQDLDQYEQTFREVAKILEPGGCFLFDITTVYNSKMNFDDYMEADSYENGAYIRHSFYDSYTNTQRNLFDIFAQDSQSEEDRYVRLEEEHIQHLFSVEEISSKIPLDLFTVSAVWNEFDPEPVKPTAERVHFLLKRI